jgi:hypothetical protein
MNAQPKRSMAIRLEGKKRSVWKPSTEHLHQGPQRGAEQDPLMNLQAFPLEFLQKFFPEQAQTKPAAERVPVQTDGVFLLATPRSINESGIVEIILRIEVDGRRLGFVDTHNRDLQQIEATTAATEKN